MKRMNMYQVKQKAEYYATNMICSYGLENTDKITKALRRLILNENKRRKTKTKG